MAGFGGAVKLTGESEYRKALQQITQKLKEVASEMKVVSTGYDANDKSTQALTAKSEVLNKQLEAQQSKVSLLKARYEELSRTEDTNSVAMSKLRTEINNAQAEANKTEKAMKSLGDETEEAGKKAEKSSGGYSTFKNILANLGTQAINSAMNGLKALGGVLVNVGKQALNSYAEFEQLEGGVKKLFGTAGMTVEEYAESVGKTVDEISDEYASLQTAEQAVAENARNAYKTAGLSANEYMEQVTNFSASLIAGLGGDTVEASRLADVAVRDMADNANTFGTDMQAIQNAYQGFAKNNFTMLDNLKLGYGGTAGEMARLVNEMGVLEDGMTVTAETVKNVGFDKMIEAIHKAQEQMRITGTTAKEASGTIQGSAGSMRAAWANLVAGLADDNADFGTLVTNFVDSLMQMLKNTLPRIKTIISGMGSMFGQLMQTIVPEIIALVPPILMETLPVLNDSIGKLLQILTQDNIPQIAPLIAETIPQAIEILLNSLPDAVDAVFIIVSTLIDSLAGAMPRIIGMIPSVLKSIITTLFKNLPVLLKSVLDLLKGLAEGIKTALPELVKMIPEIISGIIEFVLVYGLPMINESAYDIIFALINGILEALPDLLMLIPDIVDQVVDMLTNPDAIGKMIDGAGKVMMAIVDGIGEAIPKLIDAVKEAGERMIDRFKNMPERWKEIGKNVITGLWNGIKNTATWLWERLKEFGETFVGKIKGIFGIHSPSKLMEDTVGKNLAQGIGIGFSDEMKSVSSKMASSIPTSFDVTSSVAGSRSAGSSYSGMVGAFKEALSQMKIELDDEVAGHFVERTVSRIVYA